MQQEDFASKLKYLQVSNIVLNQSKLSQFNPNSDKSPI